MTSTSLAGRSLAGRSFRSIAASSQLGRRSPAFRAWRGVCRAQSGSREEAGGDLDAQLLQDLERMRAKSQQQQQPGQVRGAASHSISQAAAEPQPGAFGGVKELVDKVLIADFFFILFALGWFGAGLAQQALTQSSALLDSWYSLWQWVFQPAIGVLMLGAIASGLVDWLKDSLQRK